VRAQAAEQGSSAAELSRRQLINSSIALGAAAGFAPLAVPQAAMANNKVLSADWEKVSVVPLPPGMGVGGTGMGGGRAWMSGVGPGMSGVGWGTWGGGSTYEAWGGGWWGGSRRVPQLASCA
jgi:hypothetical protein